MKFLIAYRMAIWVIAWPFGAIWLLLYLVACGPRTAHSAAQEMGLLP